MGVGIVGSLREGCGEGTHEPGEQGTVEHFGVCEEFFCSSLKLFILGYYIYN